MRLPEWIQIVTVSSLAIVATLRRIDSRRQFRVVLHAVVTIAVILVCHLCRLMGAYGASILFDWLPGALMLIPYWQVGQFFTVPDQVMEERLSAFDDEFFHLLRIRPAETRIPKPIAAYLELAYFLVYPLVPLGVLVLYTTGLRSEVDFYWITVLSTTYICYGCTLAIRARPPRTLTGYAGFHIAKTDIRAINREILNRASIQAITCPSAHVASALAATLVLIYLSTSIGVVFVAAALSIAAATVVGGYHYVADVLSAVAVAIFVFAIVYFLALRGDLLLFNQ